MTSKILIVGDSRRTVRELQILLQATSLREKGIDVQIVDQDEAAKIAQSEDRRIQVSAEEVKTAFASQIEVALQACSFDALPVSQYAYDVPDRPAWVSPYGPARKGRRK